MWDWYCRNFTHKEMQCPCCGKEAMGPDFMERLQTARDIAGIPFKINSGWRCNTHNAEVGGVETSSHLTGHAADIQADTSQKRLIIIDALLRAGFCRMGVAKTFIHVDDDENKPQERMWLY